MSRRRPSNEQESLIECLREEARRSRPEFQPALHRRIWEAVGRERAAQSPSSPAPRTRSIRWAISALATAATLLVAVYLTSKAPTKASPRPGPGLVLLMDSPHLGAQHVDRFLSEVGPSEAWTSLRHDAELAWNTFTEDFPLANGRKRSPQQGTPSLVTPPTLGRRAIADRLDRLRAICSPDLQGPRSGPCRSGFPA